MNESMSVTSSSLAITEKKPRKTGGCVGIFFQLFDWNRRFAKKKLFSKRLLPPDRAKEASKKFGGDEKLPKLRLIADENSGGFPNMNKSGVSSGNNNEGKNGVRTPSLVARLMGLESMPSVHREKLKKDNSGEISCRRSEKVVGDSDEFEKETIRQEFRPQKLQKTGMIERRTVTRFGAEALQLKNVISRSRKHHHHHPKLATPIKSTSHHSKRNSSRLMGAATRILEPGLQSRNKAKCAITYTHSARIKNENLDLSESSHRYTNTTMLLNGQPSCKNCGNLLAIAESTSARDAHTTVFDSVNQNSVQGHEFLTDRTPIDHGGYVQWHQTNQHSQSRNFASSVYFKDNPQKPVDAFPSQSIFSDTKDFVALNRSLSGHRTRSRVPAKVEDIKFDKRGKFDNCLSQGQKRHFTHIRKQGESSSIAGRPRMVSSVASTGKNTRPDSCFMDHEGQINKNSDGMMFRFSSPMKHRGEVPTKLEKKKNPNGSPCKPVPRKKYLANHIDEKIFLQKPASLTGDSLGAILEEKLKELANREEDESGMNGVAPKRTTANIFQELICALNMERPFFGNNIEFSSQRNSLPHHRKSFCLQKSENAGALFRYKNNDHLSPGSVLEASFSNESCCSSSLEDSSGHMQHDESQLPDSEENTRNEFVSNLVSYISEAIRSIDTRQKGDNKLSHAKEVILNAELLLGNNSFMITHFLVDQLETLADVMWKSFGNWKQGYGFKGFVFDCLIEYLDSKYVRYLNCGFRAWMNVPCVMNCDVIIDEVVEEVRRWLVAEVVERDMGKWTDFEVEAFENGAEIEGEIFEMLVDEIVVGWF